MAGVRRFTDIPYTPGFTQTYSAGKSLPFLSQEPGESAYALHQRRLAAAQTQEQRRGTDLNSLLARFQKAEEEARAANLTRYQEAMGIYKDIESMYAPGGTFGKGYEAMLERAKTKSVAGGMQHLVSAGLAGTTRAGGLERLFEEEVGMPQRLKLEDIRTQQLTEAKRARAGFIERRQDEYPDYALMAQLMRQIA